MSVNVISLSPWITRNWLFKHKFFVLPLLVLVSSACFCQYDPYAHLIATKRPRTSDVVGVYILKEQTLTLEGLSFLQGMQATIELGSGNVYTATNFPIWKETGIAEYQFDKLLSTTGNWEIETSGSVGNETAWGIRFTSPVDTLELFPDVTNNTPPHGLLFTYGDPDSGEVMIFEKK